LHPLDLDQQMLPDDLHLVEFDKVIQCGSGHLNVCDEVNSACQEDKGEDAHAYDDTFLHRLFVDVIAGGKASLCEQDIAVTRQRQIAARNLGI
jgi:hypothetical protein